MTHSFEHNGIHITDSSMDESGRFEVNPLEYYGFKIFNSLDDLTKVYQDYCKKEKLEYIDAFEYLFDPHKLTSKQYEWIKDFNIAWELIETKEFE